MEKTLGKKAPRQSSPNRKIKDNEMKKSKSLEYKRTASAEREVNNVWDIITTKPDYAKALLLDQQKIITATKATKSSKLESRKSGDELVKRDSVVDNLQNNQQALKQVLKRKEQLQNILKHLKEGGNEKRITNIKKLKKSKKSQKSVKTLPPFFPTTTEISKDESISNRANVCTTKDGSVPDTDIRSALSFSNAVPQKMVDFQKLFSDIPSVVNFEESEVKTPNNIFSDKETVESNYFELNLDKLTIENQNQVKAERASFNSLSKNELEDKTRQKLKVFEESLLQFPYLMRQFYTSLPKAHDEGGLSVFEQGHVIHFGMKLETKILEMIDQYIIFTKQIEDVISEAQKY